MPFQHNSWAIASPILIPNILQATHSVSDWNIVHTNGKDQGSICSSNCCAPAHMDFHNLMTYHAAMKHFVAQPSISQVSLPFWSMQLPYLLMYRSLVLHRSTLLSLGMTGAKPPTFKTKPPHFFRRLVNRTSSKMGPLMDLQECGKRALKVWIRKMQTA